MKSKKLISLLCAAALTASSFASLAITASAADTVLYSNNFNGYTNNQMLAVARPGGDMPSAWVDAANGGNTLFQALISEETPNNVTFTDANSATVKVQAGEANPDDTGIVYAYEREEAGDTYISLPKSRFSNKTGGMKLDLSTLKAADGEDFVVSFKAMLSAATDGETAAFSIGSNDGTVSLTSSALTADTWGDVRIVVSASGAATLYVNNEEKSSGTVDMTNGMTLWVDQYSAGTKKDDGKYARVNIDDLVVMSVAAGTGATVTVPAAENPSGGTGPIVVKKEAAPLLAAPESVTPVVNQNFSKSVSITSQTDAEGDTSIDGLKVVLGNVDDNVSSAVTSEYAKGDKVLKLTGGSKSTAGRGPVVSAADPLEIADGKSSVMTFAVNLGSTSSDGAGRLYILQSTRQAGNTQDGEYNAVMAVLATDEYSFVNGDTEVAVNNLEADTWYKVGIVVSSDKYRVWVAKADEDWTTTAQVYNDHVGQGESNLQVTSLPYLAVTSSKASSGGAAPSNLTYSVARIDNMLTYSGTSEEPRYLLPTVGEAPEPTVENHSATITWDSTAKKATITAAADEEEAFDGVLIHAAYDNHKVLTSVKTYNAKNITTDGIEVAIPDTDKVYTGDKLMLWNNLQDMVPYGMATVEEGEAPIVKYTVAAAAAENGTVKVNKTTAEAGEEVTITATPAEGYELDTITVKDADNGDVAVADNKFTMPAKNVTVTATFKAVYVPPATYTVSGTVDANVDTVTLTDKADAAKKFTGTIAETAVTFSNVPAGTYTIGATAKAGFEIDTIKVADADATEVTVTDADVTTLAIATKASAKPAITGTVTITGTPAVGETLTANVNGLNEGETAVYAWSAKVADAETFTAIEGATGATLEVTETMIGAQIKVTVTSEGTSGQLDSEPTDAVPALPAPEVPTLAGTTLSANDFSTAGDIWGWNSGRGNSVKNENGVLSILNNVNAGSADQIDHKIFEKAISDSTSVEMMFDYLPQIDEGTGRSSSLVLSDGTDKTTVGNPILTLTATGNAGVTYAVGAGEAVKIADKGGASTKLKVYVKLAEGKADVLIFDITGAEPTCVANVSEAEVSATCLKRMAVTMINSLAPVAIDNVQINTTDTGLVSVTVTAPDAADGTLAADANFVRANDVITITPKVATGKKVTAVKVNGNAITANEDAYTYTVTGEEEAIAVTAEFARADATAVEISGDASVAIANGTAAYTAVVKAGDATVDGTVTWSVAAKDGAAALDAGTTINAETGVLTIAANQEATTVVITASTKKDVANAEDTDVVTATKEVTLEAEPVYAVTKGAETNGTFTISAVQAKAGDTITVVPTPATGYAVKEVSYTVGETKTVVTENNGAYTFTGLTGNATVNVEFEIVNYTITNNNAELVNESKLEVDKTTATIGETVTITPTIKDGALMVLSVKNGDADVETTAADEGKYTFVMPAGNVVVSAQFVFTKEVELTSEQVVGTYIDMTEANADTSFIDTANGTFNIGYMNISGGKLVARNKTYADQASAAIISADASEHLGKIYGAKISFDMTAGANNTWINVVGEYANYIDMKAEGASVTGNNINDLGGTPTSTYSFAAWTYGSTKNTTVSHTIPIDNIFTKDADGKVTMYIYTGTGRLNTISNVKITLTVADESAGA